MLTPVWRTAGSTRLLLSASTAASWRGKQAASCFSLVLHVLPFPLPFWPVLVFSSHSHCPDQLPVPKRPPCHTFPGAVPGVQLSYSKPQVQDDIPVIKAGPNYLVLCYVLCNFRVLKLPIFEWWEVVFFNPFQVISLCHCAFPELDPDQSLSTECPLQKHLIWSKANKCWGESWRPEKNSFPLILAM